MTNGPKPLTSRAKLPFIVPMTVAGGFFMEGLDSTILGTSLPQIAESLNVTPPELSLAITSYLLSLAVFIPVSGWIADRFGARRVYCWAMVLFTLGSALCGIAQNIEMLIAMRIAQGMGGALMTPVGRLIVVRSFPKDQLITAMNYMTIPAMIGPMLGPVVGGFLTTYLSWHWIFFINIPIGAIGIWLALRFIEDAPLPRAAPFDFKGFIIIAVGLVLGQLALEYAGRGMIPVWAQIALAGASAAVLTLYGLYARTTPNAVLDLQFFRIRTFAVSVIAGGLSRVGIGAIPFLLPLLLQVGFGYDAFHAGALVFVTTLGAWMMRMGVRLLLQAVGLRAVLIGNAALMAVMLAGFALLSADMWLWLLVSYLLAFGFVRSIQLSTLNALGYADLAHEDMSRATSVFAVVQRLSMSSGVAISAGLLTFLTDGGAITSRDFALVFCIVGTTALIPIAGYWRLKAEDGAVLTATGPQDGDKN